MSNRTGLCPAPCPGGRVADTQRGRVTSPICPIVHHLARGVIVGTHQSSSSAQVLSEIPMTVSKVGVSRFANRGPGYLRGLDPRISNSAKSQVGHLTRSTHTSRRFTSRMGQRREPECPRDWDVGLSLQTLRIDRNDGYVDVAEIICVFCQRLQGVGRQLIPSPLVRRRLRDDRAREGVTHSQGAKHFVARPRERVDSGTSRRGTCRRLQDPALKNRHPPPAVRPARRPPSRGQDLTLRRRRKSPPGF